MNHHTLLGRTVVVAAVALALGCATATVHASSPSGGDCAGLQADDKALADKLLASAQLQRTLHTERQFAKVTMKRRAGVELFVPAQQGVTQPWLERVVACRMAEPASAESLFAVEGAKLEVVTVSKGYLLRLTAETSEAAGELIRRAHSG